MTPLAKNVRSVSAPPVIRRFGREILKAPKDEGRRAMDPLMVLQAIGYGLLFAAAVAELLRS